jgi:hypothetical protein
MTIVRTRSRAGRLAATAGAVVLAATGLTIAGSSDTASAAGCYNSSKSVAKPDGMYVVPGGVGWFKTTSACQDINFKLTNALKGRAVKVCFQRTGCQDHWTVAERNTWTVIATDVKDGTNYRFEFKSDDKASGLRAD